MVLIERKGKSYLREKKNYLVQCYTNIVNDCLFVCSVAVQRIANEPRFILYEFWEHTSLWKKWVLILLMCMRDIFLFYLFIQKTVLVKWKNKLDEKKLSRVHDHTL